MHARRVSRRRWQVVPPLFYGSRPQNLSVGGGGGSQKRRPSNEWAACKSCNSVDVGRRMARLATRDSPCLLKGKITCTLLPHRLLIDDLSESFNWFKCQRNGCVTPRTPTPRAPTLRPESISSSLKSYSFSDLKWKS